MKSKFKNLLNNPMLIIFFVIMLVFMPAKIFAPGENRERGVVTAVGIDKVEDDYEVSFLVFIPSVNQSFDDKESVITGKGKSVGEAVYEAQLAMGRKIGLYHTKTTVVNLALMEEDGVNALDYFGRLPGFPENTIFICTNNSAKDLLSSTQSLRDNLGFKLEQIVGYNADHVYVTDTSLESFYRGYYSPTKSSIVGFLTTATKDEEEDYSMQVTPAEEEQSSEGANGGGSSSGGGGNDPKTIVNTGKSAIVKNGKIVKILSLEQINAINLLNKKLSKQVIKIDDVLIEDQRVNAVYEILKKDINLTTKFENGIPIFDAKVDVNLSLIELENSTSELKINNEFTRLSEEAAHKIDQKLKNSFANIVKILKEEKTDVIGLNELFMKNNRKEYMRYLDQNISAEDFIENVVFKLELILEAD